MKTETKEQSAVAAKDDDLRCPRCGEESECFQSPFPHGTKHAVRCMAVECDLESPYFYKPEEALEWWSKPFDAGTRYQPSVGTSTREAREAVEEVQRFADYMADATYGGISESRQATLGKALRALIASVTKPTVSREEGEGVMGLVMEMFRGATEPLRIRLERRAHRKRWKTRRCVVCGGDFLKDTHIYEGSRNGFSGDFHRRCWYGEEVAKR